MKITALIMAGGRGERFWPKSRKTLPKQFLSLTGDGKTMIQLTVERLRSFISNEDIFIVTNKEYFHLVAKQLPDIPQSNILCEPVGRNTAPCIGLGAIHIEQKYQDAIMIVLPSDHVIKYSTMYVSTLREGCRVAEKDDNIVTIGITPDCPETGYGYIKFDPNNTCDSAFAVEKIVEKPSLDVAKEYLASEEYLWNSGMFIWKLSTFMKNLQNLMPDIYEGLLDIKKAISTSDYEIVLERIYKGFRSESIDYGIMEHANNIHVLPGTFGWDDVGSWLAVERIRKTNEYGNTIQGNVITIDSKNCIIEGGSKLIATVGLKDLIIVDTDDAILICEKDSAGNIKQILENLKICNRNEYL
jgi:mannose-1-phosphate guanylyltransferase